MRPTATLVRLHIDQGYLGRARVLMEALARGRGGRLPPDLEVLWQAAAARARREARIQALKRLLARVRRARARA
jgi:hypothetical protein